MLQTLMEYGSSHCLLSSRSLVRIQAESKSYLPSITKKFEEYPAQGYLSKRADLRGKTWVNVGLDAGKMGENPHRNPSSIELIKNSLVRLLSHERAPP